MTNTQNNWLLQWDAQIRCLHSPRVRPRGAVCSGNMAIPEQNVTAERLCSEIASFAEQKTFCYCRPTI